MSDWVIHLYRCDCQGGEPVQRDLGIPPIYVPAPDLEGAGRLARAALWARSGRGPASPNAGRVEDGSGRVALRLQASGVNHVQVDVVDDNPGS